MEFDLVSPYFVPEPTDGDMERVRVASGLAVPRSLEEIEALRGLTVRINYLDLIPDAGRRSINEDLEEFRVLIGPDDWRRYGEEITGAGRRDPRTLKKMILSIRNSFKI